MERITAISYSSSANLGPGFDTLALCHDFGHDRVTVTVAGNGKAGVTIISNDTPTSPGLNSAGRAAQEFLKKFGISDSVSIEIEKGIPLSSGLGGSGSSSAATVTALDQLYGTNLTKDEKIMLSGYGESGSIEGRHYDNVAASILGGLVIVGSKGRIQSRRIEISPEFKFIIAVPHVEIVPSKTEKMRSIIPDTITREKHIMNTASLAFLITGFQSGDGELIRLGMNDFIFEPERGRILGYYDAVRSAAIKSGAIGACLSGAGPSLLFVCTQEYVEKVMIGIKEKFHSLGISCSVKEVKQGPGVRIEL